MKAFTLILCFYLAFLNCLPCGDSQECNVNTPEVVLAGASHDDHGHTDEACTPFCNCSCCSASAQCQPILYFEVEHIPSPLTWTQELDNLYSFEFHFIWQPPKIA